MEWVLLGICGVLFLLVLMLAEEQKRFRALFEVQTRLNECLVSDVDRLEKELQGKKDRDVILR